MSLSPPPSARDRVARKKRSKSGPEERNKVRSNARQSGRSRGLTRDESKLITRNRLLDAGRKVLAEAGYAGLTASQVSRRAGIAQSSFYVHFRDKNELVTTLSEELAHELRQAMRESRQYLLRSASSDVVRDSFRLPLERVIEFADSYRLVLRERHLPESPLGRFVREMVDDLRSDLTKDLIAMGFPARTARGRRRAEMVAESFMASAEALTLGYLDGRYPDLDEVFDALADMAMQQIAALR